MTEQKPGRRVILDTNLWSDIGNDGTGTSLGRELKRRGYELLLTPSVLLEVLRSSDDDGRRRRVQAMLDSRGFRLPSEAELCATDFISAIRRLRPEWILQLPNPGTWHQYNGYWTKRVWRESLEAPDVLHAFLMRDGSTEAQQVQAQRENRRSVLESKFNGEFSTVKSKIDQSSPYARTYVGLSEDTAVDHWRVDVGDLYWINMSRSFVHGHGFPGQTERDWLGCHIHLRRATSDKADFRRLWFDDLSPADVRRDWLRSAVRFTQAQMKVTAGNLRDEQHSAYLPDGDLFLTSDKRFVRVIQTVRHQAAFDLAEPILISTADSSAALDRVINGLP